MDTPNRTAADETKGRMKLSEAIRAGAKLRPQGWGDAALQVREGRSCVLLAAYEGMFGALPAGGLLDKDVAPALRRFNEECPECRSQFHSPQSILVHLNDRHGWTREAIADYVERIESAR